MPEKGKQKISKATRNYYLNLLTLFPFLILLISGFTLLRYHGGMDYELPTAGLNGHNWLLVHRIFGLTVIPLIGIHLWHHKYWFRTFFNKKNRGKTTI